MIGGRTLSGRSLMFFFLFVCHEDVAAAGSNTDAHEAGSLSSLLRRPQLCRAISPAFATFETAVCLASSSVNSSRTPAFRSPSQERPEADQHDGANKEDRGASDDDDDDADEIDAAATAAANGSEPATDNPDQQSHEAGPQLPQPWRQGNCQTDDKEGVTFCAFVHPSFSNGQGLAVVTTAERLRAIAARPVFVTNDSTSGEWPPPYDAASAASAPLGIAWRAEAIPGKDIGVVAARTIRRGERVMARTPAVMVDGHAVDALTVAAFTALLNDGAQRLPADHSAHFYSLSTNYGAVAGPEGGGGGGHAAYQIFATNAFRTGLGDGEPDLHSVFRTHEERRAKLHRHWGFNCTCARCAQQPHLRAESDDRVQSIRALLTELDNYGMAATEGNDTTVKTPAAAAAGTPAKAELLVLLFELEGLHARMHEAYYRLAVEWNGVGDAWRAAQAARRCLDRGLLVRGPDQFFVRSMRELLADPTTHWSWEFRTKGVGRRRGETGAD
ncbi:hypothetical protein SPI_07122 [Niveomyces insectorum RCEF 264]|uniref:SET domain-containing protein n=1 Tax=Niveomyces insectorum RCEF 264 TaxID=1081102 RepID=A0A167QAR9_9HYPO|nr:hypothetical protein SPI_07122 [Niveomyces insectorum RCEF 264]